MMIFPVPGCGTRKPRDVTSALQILQKLADGWRLYIGTGHTSYICRLERAGEKSINLWRQRVGALRDAGMIAYVMGQGCVKDVLLTDKGRQMLATGRLSVEVRTAHGRRLDR